MQGHSEVAAFICHAVEAKLVGHIRHLVFLVRLLGGDLHRSFFPFRVRELEPSLGQVPPQNLHQAMGVAVVMDRAPLSRTPDKHQLSLESVDILVGRP